MFEVGDIIVTTPFSRFEWLVTEVEFDRYKLSYRNFDSQNEWASIGWHRDLSGLVKKVDEPEVDEELVITKYVYVAYVKHQFRGTELALSAITEEKLDAAIRGHPGYTVLAKKRIKFTL